MQNSKTAWIIIIVIVVLLGAGIWWGLYPSSVSAPTGGAQNEIGSSNASAGIDQVLSSIDGELNKLSSDSQSVEQSLNDKPIEQAE